MKKTAEKKNDFDAIVLGCGAAGYGIALGLARERQKVLMVGRRLAGESTPASAGILDPYLDMQAPTPLFHLNRSAFYDYPSWLKFLKKTSGKDPKYEKFGMLYISFTRDDEKKAKIWYGWQKNAGIRVKKVSRSWIRKNEPGVQGAALSGLFYPQIGRVRPRRLLEVLKTAARRMGIRTVMFEGEPVLKISKGRAQGVFLGKRFFSAPKAVNATGAWAGLTRKAGSRLPVFPVRGQILLARGKKKLTRRILHDFRGNYIVPWRKNEYLLGSTVEKAGFIPKVTAAGFKKVKSGNEYLLPGLKEFKLAGKWAGLRPCAQDYLPIIGPSRIPNLYLACGYYRSGILISGYAGRLLARALKTGQIPSLLKPFAPKRFYRS